MLYILTGLPYSGKTTLRRELMKRFNFKSVSVDEIMDQENMSREGHPTQEDWDQAYSTAYEKLKEYLKNKYTVIFDCGNLPFHERENARQIAKEVGSQFKLIYVNTSKDEILLRRTENQQTKIRGHLDDTMMDTALKLFDEPSAQEQPITYNQHLNLEKWIKIHFL